MYYSTDEEKCQEISEKNIKKRFGIEIFLYNFYGLRILSINLRKKKREKVYEKNICIVLRDFSRKLKMQTIRSKNRYIS